MFLSVNQTTMPLLSPTANRSIPLTDEIGANLMQQYLMPFEWVSVLLLVILLGALEVVNQLNNSMEIKQNID